MQMLLSSYKNTGTSYTHTWTQTYARMLAHMHGCIYACTITHTQNT